MCRAPPGVSNLGVWQRQARRLRQRPWPCRRCRGARPGGSHTPPVGSQPSWRAPTPELHASHPVDGVYGAPRGVRARWGHVSSAAGTGTDPAGRRARSSGVGGQPVHPAGRPTDRRRGVPRDERRCRPSRGSVPRPRGCVGRAWSDRSIRRLGGPGCLGLSTIGRSDGCAAPPPGVPRPPAALHPPGAPRPDVCATPSGCHARRVRRTPPAVQYPAGCHAHRLCHTPPAVPHPAGCATPRQLRHTPPAVPHPAGSAAPRRVCRTAAGCPTPRQLRRSPPGLPHPAGRGTPCRRTRDQAAGWRARTGMVRIPSVFFS
jgi:hypothetical protein